MQAHFACHKNHPLCRKCFLLFAFFFSYFPLQTLNSEVRCVICNEHEMCNGFLGRHYLYETPLLIQMNVCEQSYRWAVGDIAGSGPGGGVFCGKRMDSFGVHLQVIHFSLLLCSKGSTPPFIHAHTHTHTQRHTHTQKKNRKKKNQILLFHIS